MSTVVEKESSNDGSVTPLKLQDQQTLDSLEDSGVRDTESNAGRNEKRKLSFNELQPRGKKQKGMNKNRGPTYQSSREAQLCPRLADRQSDTDPLCKVASCTFMHDIKQFMDLKLPPLGDECYVFNTRGYCPRGLTCRFSSKHVTEDGLNVVNQALYDKWKSNPSLQTINSLSHDAQTKLRKKSYNFEKAERIVSEIAPDKPKHSTPKTKIEQENGDENIESVAAEGLNGNAEMDTEEKLDHSPLKHIDVSYDSKLHTEEEKRKIDWSGKLFLSPLTTLGNLPFRRICKEFGADVTCGEMAMATNLLQGKTQEWALTKRHGTEDLFGVQVCGSNPKTMAKCAQLVREQADIDFLDLNVGCPIDLVYQQGAGSGLLNRKKVLFSVVKCMKSVLDIPLTLKTRVGVHKGKNVVHTFIKDLTEAGVDLITIHGRTKEQRYAKLADWDYVEQCAQLAAPTPVIGNGDILSYVDYDLARERSPSSTSIMIGRGALIKPWIFTEIKERRHWDISSQERFQILQKYTNYGLEHWGSDTKGVESTRRFLLEWLSFLYRYVPVGLMEGPQKMNERPPPFEGRDELETLMASPNCADWIKISEMLLGPVPSGFQFLPKHKANSWT